MKKKLIKVSLLEKKIHYNNLNLDYEISDDIRERLLNGYDDIELTLKKKKLIDLYENKNFYKESWRTIDNERKS